MIRTELILMFALDAIADDYEDEDMIYSHVKRLGDDCGLTVAESEIESAIRELLERGLARAYLLPHNQPPIITPYRSGEDNHLHYFYVTDVGRQLQMAEYAEWPFDDNGQVRANWSLSPR